MIKVFSDNGRVWVLEVTGDTVKFYDARFEHTDLGQFVSSYYIDTVLEVDGGLCLDGGVPYWSIGPGTMTRIKTWLQGLPD